MTENDSLNYRYKEICIFSLILLLAFIHGTIYIFLMPPWQHYDEPNHFEYVWMAANLDHLPQVDYHNSEMSREVVASMLENGFFDGIEEKPELGPPGQDIMIPGYSQLGEPPLYYLIASIPLRLIDFQNIVSQMYATRLVSVLFLLITILASWGMVREITSEGNALRWMLPLTLALLPGFVDVMASGNSDSAAVAVFSLFFWGSVRLIKRGFNFLDLFWVFSTVILTYFTKNTAMYAIFLFPFVILFSIFKNRSQKAAWGIIAFTIVLGLIVTFGWGDAAFWYRATSQEAATRIESEQALIGDYVFHLDTKAEITPNFIPALFQPLANKIGAELINKPVTFGAWIWASEPIKIDSPSIHTPSSKSRIEIKINQEPAFFAFNTLMPFDSWRTWIVLAQKFSQQSDVDIYLDGLVLAEGEYSLDDIPVYGTPDGSYGEWGGKPFINLLQNSSAEMAGPRIRVLFDNLGTKILPDQMRLSLILTSILDLDSSGFLYKISIERLFKTFWALFGWGHIPLILPWFYGILWGFSIIGLLGLLIGLTQKRNQTSWDLVFVFGILVLVVWGLTILRGTIYLAVPRLYIPVARHAYTIIIPTIFIVCAGWEELFSLLRSFLSKKIIRRQEKELSSLQKNMIIYTSYAAYIIFFIGFDLLSIASIINYY